MTSKKATRTTLNAPWWVSLMSAILSYILLKYLAPQFNPNHPGLQELCKAAPTFAPIITIPFLLLAAKQLYDGDKHPKNDNDTDDAASR